MNVTYPVSRLWQLYQFDGFAGIYHGIYRWWKFNANVDYRLRLAILRIGSIMSDQIIYRNIHGSLLRLDLKKEGVHRELGVYGTREKRSLEHYERRLQELDEQFGQIYVLDIGANIGHFALLAERNLTNPTVVAAEPDPRNIEELKTNCLLNESNIRIEPVACGAEPGETELHLHRRSNWSSIEWADEDVIDTVAVDLTTIDELVRKYNIPQEALVILRMDTEGYEQQILEGAPALFDSDRSIYLFTELHPKKLPGDGTMRDLADLLTDAGFELDCFREGKGHDPYPIDAEIDDLRNWQDHPRLCKNGTHLFAERIEEAETA